MKTKASIETRETNRLNITITEQADMVEHGKISRGEIRRKCGDGRYQAVCSEIDRRREARVAGDHAARQEAEMDYRPCRLKEMIDHYRDGDRWVAHPEIGESGFGRTELAAMAASGESHDHYHRDSGGGITVTIVDEIASLMECDDALIDLAHDLHRTTRDIALLGKILSRAK